MSDVPASRVRAAIAVLEDASLDLEASCAGLDALQSVRRGDEIAVAWDEYVTMINRATAGLDGPTLERIGARYLEFAREIRVLAQLAVSASHLAQLVLRMAPLSWPALRFAHAWTSARDVSVEIEVPPPATPCPAWLRFTAGMFRALPCSMGLPEAVVDHELGERHGRFDVHLPSGDAPAPRDLRSIDPSELGPLVEHLLDAALGPPGAAIGRVPAALVLQREWGLTRMEARVARRLATGMRLKDVASELGISQETARTHLKQLFSKTGTHRQVALVALLRGLPLER